MKKIKEPKNPKLELYLLDCSEHKFVKVGGENTVYLIYFSMMYNFKYIDMWDVDLFLTCVLVLQLLTVLH